MVNQVKLDQFMGVYEPALREAVTHYPNEYLWPVEQVPIVAARMRAAIERNSHNHDGHAFKGACKALGIKHTRKAIDQFLERN